MQRANSMTNRFLITAALVALALPGTAPGQAPDQPVIEEILVTATKREASDSGCSHSGVRVHRRRSRRQGRDGPVRAAGGVAFRSRCTTPTARPTAARCAFAAWARRGTIRAWKPRWARSSTASIARVRDSPSTTWWTSTGWRCCAGRRARCSGRTRSPAR